MVVARAVSTANGAVLLRPGTEIQPPYIAQLQRLGIPAVYIQNPLAPDLDVPEPVTAEVRQAATAHLKAAMDGFAGTVSATVGGISKRFSPVNLGVLKESVAAIVDQVRSSPQVLLHLVDIRSADEWTLQHSVSVAITSVMVGRQLGLSPQALQDLGVGALLHDVGKQALPDSILKATGPLSPEQQAEYRQHTVLGFEILKKHSELSLVSAAIALQHHERWGGGGYPRGIKGTEIHELARIVAVVDQFDNLVADRMDRAGLPSERALLVMQALTREHFEPRVVDALIAVVAKYPVGTVVTLSDGSLGIVVAVDRQHMEQPKVRLIRDKHGEAIREPNEVDLAHTDLKVVGTVRSEGRT
jgi:putative nucleotidyltransferase with HDIG domain